MSTSRDERQALAMIAFLSLLNAGVFGVACSQMFTCTPTEAPMIERTPDSRELAETEPPPPEPDAAGDADLYKARWLAGEDVFTTRPLFLPRSAR